MEITCYEIHGMQFDRQLTGWGLIQQEGLQRLPDRGILLESQQAVGCESKIARPALTEITITCMEHFHVLGVPETPGLNPGPQILGGNEQRQRLLGLELIWLREDFPWCETRLSEDSAQILIRQ